MPEISYNIKGDPGYNFVATAPDVFIVEGYGWIDYLEFEDTIWMQDFYSITPGKGVRVAREFVKFATKKGKDLYGEINVYDIGHGMSTERLMKMYIIMGAKPIIMKGYPNAVMLEVKKNGS